MLRGDVRFPRSVFVITGGLCNEPPAAWAVAVGVGTPLVWGYACAIDFGFLTHGIHQFRIHCHSTFA